MLIKYFVKKRLEKLYDQLYKELNAAYKEVFFNIYVKHMNDYHEEHEAWLKMDRSKIAEKWARLEEVRKKEKLFKALQAEVKGLPSPSWLTGYESIEQLETMIKQAPALLVKYQQVKETMLKIIAEHTGQAA